MLFPNYPHASYRPKTSLVDGYLRYLGQNEDDNRQDIKEYRKRHLRNIAMRIGRGCLIAVNNNAQAAQRLFRRAKRDSAPAITPERRQTGIGRIAMQLHLIADLLEKSDDLEQSVQTRREMHRQTVEDVRQLQTNVKHAASNGRRFLKAHAGAPRGELAQKVALGLITRYAHPWMMAVPSLLHHDNGRVAKSNYDMLVVESMPKASETQAYKVQVKTDCAGLCCDRPERRTAQQLYNQDIIVVSACCDLQRGDNRDTTLSDFRVADLLVKEYDGIASEEEIHELDGFSDSLILSITMGDERRMGTIPLEDN